MDPCVELPGITGMHCVSQFVHHSIIDMSNNFVFTYMPRDFSWSTIHFDFCANIKGCQALSIHIYIYIVSYMCVHIKYTRFNLEVTTPITNATLMRFDVTLDVPH